MTELEMIEGAEAPSLASPGPAAPGRGLPSPAMPGRAVPSHDASLYHQKVGRVLLRLGGVYTFGDILERLKDGRMQSFAHGNSLLVTQVNVYPRAKALDFLLAVGDLQDWRPIHDEAVAFAERHDISLIRAYGRRGWAPFAKDRGWRILTTNQVYVKEL